MGKNVVASCILHLPFVMVIPMFVMQNIRGVSESQFSKGPILNKIIKRFDQNGGPFEIMLFTVTETSLDILRSVITSS